MLLADLVPNPLRVLPFAALLALLAGCGATDIDAPPVVPEPGIIGLDCQADNWCGDAPLYCHTGLPGGFCTVRCTPLNPLCPGDTLCRATTENGWCVPQCSGDADCREGYACVELGADDGAVYRVCESLVAPLPLPGTTEPAPEPSPGETGMEPEPLPDLPVESNAAPDASGAAGAADGAAAETSPAP